VPTFNSERTLLACLRSVCNQSYPFREIIIINNFSHDNTLKIAKQFGAKIIQMKCNPALARNLGVTNSHGEFVLFLDSDQILSKGVIDECVHLCASENADMVWIPEVFMGKISGVLALPSGRIPMEEWSKNTEQLGTFWQVNTFLRQRTDSPSRHV